MTTTTNLLDLLQLETREEILQAFLTELAELGWPVTDWEEGGVGLTLLQVIARSHGDISTIIGDICRGGLLDESTGQWLTLLAASFFQLTRKAAQSAVIRVTLTCAATAGPYSITAGGSTIVTATGYRYTSTNTGTETLPTNDTLVLDYKAESPGVAYNLDLSAVISLVTSLPGVTVAVTEVGDTGSPVVTAGSNEETDAQLRTRCRGRWATLGAEKTHEAYAFLATSIADLDPDLAALYPGVLTINRVLVDDTNPDGPGTIRIYLAGDAGGITDADTIAAANTFLQARKGLCASLTVHGATNDTVTVAASLTCESSRVDNALTEIESALAEYQASLTIGDGTSIGVVYRSQIVEFLMAPEGVINTTISSVLLAGSASDYTPAKGHIPLLSYSGTITITPV